MDLHFTADEPTPEERQAVDGCLAARRRRTATTAGSTCCPCSTPSRGASAGSARGAEPRLPRLEVPPAEAFGVADFYALFQTRPHPPVTVHVCDDIACRVARRRGALRRMEAALGPAGASRAGPASPPGTAAPASASASGRPPRWSPRPATRRASRRWPRRRGAEVRSALAGETVPPPAGRALGAPGRPARPARCSPASAGSIPRASTTTAPPAASWPCAAPSRWGPSGGRARSIDSKLVGRGGAAFPTGAEVAGRCARRRCRATSSATPTSPSPARSRIACSWRTTRSR